MTNGPIRTGAMDTRPANEEGVARFDAALRRHHAEAVARISPRVQAQLAQRRNSALRGQGVAAQRHGFRYAVAAFAAVFALALGMQLGPLQPGNAPTSAPASLVTVGPERGATTVLDEDPTFYAWLDSSDVRQLAME